MFGLFGSQISSVLEWFVLINVFVLGAGYLISSFVSGRNKLGDEVIALLKKKDEAQQNEIESLHTLTETATKQISAQQIKIQNSEKKISGMKEVLSEALQLYFTQHPDIVTKLDDVIRFDNPEKQL